MNDFKNLEALEKKFNWGAFLLTPIWGIFNKTYITLLFFIFPFIPYIGIILTLIFAIYFGINGNRLALKNKKWNSVEDFNKNQKCWTIIGFVVTLLTLIQYLNTEFQYRNINIFREKRNELKDFMKDTMLKINSDKKVCGSTTNELLTCFAEKLNVKQVEEDTIKTNEFGDWEFYGEDRSKTGYNYVYVDLNGGNKPNKMGLDILQIPLKTDKKGKFLIEENIKMIPMGIVIIK